VASATFASAATSPSVGRFRLDPALGGGLMAFSSSP
jgi:hypothetical protein